MTTNLMDFIYFPSMFQISIADYVMYDVLDLHEILAPGCLDAFPSLKGYYDRIAARPNLAAYFATDEYNNQQINGNQNK